MWHKRNSPSEVVHTPVRYFAMSNEQAPQKLPLVCYKRKKNIRLLVQNHWMLVTLLEKKYQLVI